MGRLIDGVWHSGDAARESNDSGSFEREETAFRNWVTPDGSAGPSGEGGFPAAAGRYHLYVSLACPWACRALIFRKLKGLEHTIGLSVVNPYMGEDGWSFAPHDGVIADPVIGADFLREIYTRAKPDYTGKVSVPVLFDRERETIVSNESADIIRMFNAAFDEFALRPEADFYPAGLRDEIDAVNARVYETVNNGVYRAGFATNQQAYEAAVRALFETLDWLEERLGRQRYLAGDRLTEADWRLFTTLVRFDPVYHGHFKCNRRRLVDYHHLWSYARELYQVQGVSHTVDFRHIKHHYYRSHASVNPTGIVPIGPDLDFAAPHDRAQRNEAA